MTDVKAHEKLIKLSNANLGDLPTFVKRANYDRSKLKAGIVHIGLAISTAPIRRGIFIA